MKKVELERALLDPEGLKRLSERASGIKQKHGQGRGRPAVRMRPVQALPHQVRPTPAEFKLNDDDHVQRRLLLADIARLVPDLAKENPKSALELLTRRCTESPTPANQFLVEDAINRVISKGKPDSEAERLVDKAIKLLGSGKAGEKEAVDSIWSRLYRHSDYEGRSLYVNHGPGYVYRRIRQSTLEDADLNDRISSLYVDASSAEVGGRVILFQKDRFNGRYAIFPTTPGAPDERAYTPYVGDYINDRTSSILVVREYENELAFSLGMLGLRDTIEDMVSDVSDVSPRGDPIITWDMWPSFAPDRRYVYLRIPIEVEIDWWPDYDAEIRLWLYFYVTAGGSLRGYVDWYGSWAESGMKSEDVADGVADAVEERLPDIEAEIDETLEAAELFEPYARQYFLPGTAGSTGHTEDDVTLVLVRR
jgi:hypothetical protein